VNAPDQSVQDWVKIDAQNNSILGSANLTLPSVASQFRILWSETTTARAAQNASAWQHLYAYSQTEEVASNICHDAAAHDILWKVPRSAQAACLPPNDCGGTIAEGVRIHRRSPERRSRWRGCGGQLGEIASSHDGKTVPLVNLRRYRQSAR